MRTGNIFTITTTTIPSGTEQAKEKFSQGVEKTRAAAEGDSMPGKKADNPKAGWFMSKVAKGDTNSSNYDPSSFGGSSRG
ncbi:hypothetical protein F4782DRAFT_528462 [Xylaria castorea]|nr:hypothetical protein F4782DRAFT_528462 [Xylaria castorea]